MHSYIPSVPHGDQNVLSLKLLSIPPASNKSCCLTSGFCGCSRFYWPSSNPTRFLSTQHIPPSSPTPRQSLHHRRRLQSTETTSLTVRIWAKHEELASNYSWCPRLQPAAFSPRRSPAVQPTLAQLLNEHCMETVSNHTIIERWNGEGWKGP